MERYERLGRQGTVEERIESVMDDYLPTLAGIQKGEDREHQYRAFLTDVDRELVANAGKVNRFDDATWLPVGLAGSFAGARIGARFGLVGAIAGACAGGAASQFGAKKAAEAYTGRSLDKVLDSYTASLDRIDAKEQV